jgi:hypothetical protein
MDAEKDKESGATEPMEDMDCFFEKKGATTHHLSYRIFCLRPFLCPLLISSFSVFAYMPLFFVAHSLTFH